MLYYFIISSQQACSVWTIILTLELEAQKEKRLSKVPALGSRGAQMRPSPVYVKPSFQILSVEDKWVYLALVNTAPSYRL